MRGGGSDGRVNARRAGWWRTCCTSLALLAACVANCGGQSSSAKHAGGAGAGASGGANPAATPVAAADFGHVLSLAYCKIAPCCQARGFSFGPLACETAVQNQVDALLSKDLADPDVAFDENAAGACVEAYKKLVIGCTDRTLEDAALAACGPVLHGTVPEGGACMTDLGCAAAPGVPYPACDGGVCIAGLGRGLDSAVHAKRGEACAGTCQQYSSGVGCDSGSVDGTAPPDAGACYLNEGLYCTGQFVCAEVPKLGEPCPDFVCAADSYCDVDTCVAARATGFCAGPDECLHTAYCDESVQMCTPREPNGASCIYDDQCESENCEENVCSDWSVANTLACEGEISI